MPHIPRLGDSGRARDVILVLLMMPSSSSSSPTAVALGAVPSCGTPRCLSFQHHETEVVAGGGERCVCCISR